MPTDKIQTGIRLNPLILEKITYIARQEHRSFNGQVEHLIEQCIINYEKENGVIPTTEYYGTIE